MSTTNPRFRAINYAQISKGTLVGTFDLQLPSGMILIGATHHRQEDKEWVGLPAKRYLGKDGREAWVKVIDFAEKTLRHRFSALALAAVKEVIGNG